MHFGVREKGLVDVKLYKYSTLIAVGIALHNFPEGVALGSSYAYLPELGITVAVAMAIHNIPEGMAIAIPACLSGCSKKSAFRLALFSGLAEPAGAIVSLLLLDVFSGFVPFGLAFAAGIMVFITLDEIIPAASQNEHEHLTSFGIIAGSLLRLFARIDVSPVVRKDNRLRHLSSQSSCSFFPHALLFLATMISPKQYK
jgi:ZIP family zinc transporter